MSQVTKRALEQSLKNLLREKPLSQNHHQRYRRGLRHQPHDLLLSLQGYL